MSVAVFTSYGQQFDNSGNPLSGGSITVYQAGTTNLITLKSASDLSGSAAANPIILDSAGRHDMRYFALEAYKVLVKNSSDVTIYTRDNIDPGVAIGSGTLAISNGGTGASTGAAALSNLGGATASEVADVAAQVAAVTGALGSTAKTHIATGTTGQRDASPVEGDFRRNTTTSRWEGFVAAWENFVTSATQLVDFRAAVPATTFQYLTSGTAATYTTPSNPAPWTLRIRMVGGGGGGGGATANNGSAGTNTLFNGIQANPGNGGGGSSNGGSTGGSGGGGSASLRIPGAGGNGINGGNGASNGGASPFGGAGRGAAGVAGLAAAANSGSGGGGGNSGASGGSGGGAGEYVEFLITSPSATYTYTVGAGGSGGAAGGQAGGNGGSGLIIVEEIY